MMRRRELLITASGIAVWPLAGDAQELRRIGMLNSLGADDSEGQARYAAFRQSLQELGWIDGQNIRIETRWAASDPGRFRAYAWELVALAPDVITATASPSVAALLQVT